MFVVERAAGRLEESRAAGVFVIFAATSRVHAPSLPQVSSWADQQGVAVPR